MSPKCHISSAREEECWGLDGNAFGCRTWLVLARREGEFIHQSERPKKVRLRRGEPSVLRVHVRCTLWMFMNARGVLCLSVRNEIHFQERGVCLRHSTAKLVKRLHSRQGLEPVPPAYPPLPHPHGHFLKSHCVPSYPVRRAPGLLGQTRNLSSLSPNSPDRCKTCLLPSTGNKREIWRRLKTQTYRRGC